MGVTEDSDESLTDHIKDDNKQLQLKVEKNEKLIQRLQLEQTEHEQVLKVSRPNLLPWNQGNLFDTICCSGR